MPICAFCGKEVEILDKVFLKDSCPHCGRDLHACVQCSFYDPGRHNDCREPQAAPVLKRDRSNHCGYFVFDVNKAAWATGREDLDRLANLFGNGAGEAKAEASESIDLSAGMAEEVRARQGLEDLFKK